MTDHNIGKILYRAFIGVDTTIARNTYRVVEVTGGWEIFRCPTAQVGQEWIDCEGNKMTAWQMHYFVPTQEQHKFLRAYGKPRLY